MVSILFNNFILKVVDLLPIKIGSCTKLGDAGVSLLFETVTTNISVLQDLAVSGTVHWLHLACAALCTCHPGRWPYQSAIRVSLVHKVPMHRPHIGL